MVIHHCLNVFAVSLLVLCATVSRAAALDLQVTELVSAIKSAVAEAEKAAEPPYATIPWMEAEISYVVKTEGAGGLKLYVVTVEGKYATEAVQRIKFRIQPTGRNWRVEGPGQILNATVAGVDQSAGKLFLYEPGASPGMAIALDVGRYTTIADLKGKRVKLSELGWGVGASVGYSVGVRGQPKADFIIMRAEQPRPPKGTEK